MCSESPEKTVDTADAVIDALPAAFRRAAEERKLRAPLRYPLDTNRKYMFVLDGSKALRAAVDRVFGQDTAVQRCPLHKLRHVADHLPEKCRNDWRRRMRAASSMMG